MISFQAQYRQKFSADLELTLEPTQPSEMLSDVWDRCKLCPLPSGYSKHKHVWGHGEIGPRLMIIGYSPSKEEGKLERLFSGKVGNKLSGMVSYLTQKCDMSHGVYYSSYLLCAEVDNKHARCGTERLFDEIKMVRPKNILLLGNKTIEALLSAYTIHGANKHSETMLDAFRLHKTAVKIGRYIPVYVTYALADLYYHGEQVRRNVKEDLDFLIQGMKEDIKIEEMEW